jgi:hypothetical protein
VAGRAITFNVVFTAGTASRLLPFALSLLQGANVRVRLVANGCAAGDLVTLRDAARAHDRVSHYVLPVRYSVEHGSALNRLFAAFPDDPYFAFADSDVIASGDFMLQLWPLAPGQAAVCAGAPVWSAEGDGVAPPGWPTLSGRMRELPDGTQVGMTYVAIYDRAAVEPFWRRAPLGFCVHHRHSVPRDLRRAFDERGWSYRLFDTCRVVNLQLILAGHAIENREVPEIHHAGGSSWIGRSSPRKMLRSLRRAPRSDEERRYGRLADYWAFRLYLARARQTPQLRRMVERNTTVSAYLREVVDAAVAGEPAPPPPRTDSDAVDRRLAELVAAVETRYARG